MKLNLTLLTLLIVIICHSACKKEKEVQPVVLDSCMTVSKKNPLVNEKITIRSCSKTPEANGAQIKVEGITNPEINFTFMLNSKNDSVRFSLSEKGQYKVTLKALKLGLILYTESVNDTLEVFE